MITKKTYLIPLFFSVLLLLALTTPLFAAADEYGNQINGFDGYEKVAGSYGYPIVSVTSETYTPDSYVDTTSNIFEFTAETQLNKTLATYAQSFNTIAAGLQILGDTTDIQGPMHAVPYYDDASFWYHYQLSDYDLITTDDDVVVNMTLWLDVERNGTWVMIEEWTFNLELEEQPEYEPELYGGLDLGFVWFWLFVGGIFFTAISAGAAIKKISLKYGIVALLAGTFTYAFFMIIAAGG